MYFGHGPTESGVEIGPSTSLSLPAVWACVDLISKAASVLPGHVYRRLSSGVRDREIVPRHYLYPIVHRMANPTLPAIEWRKIVLAHLLGWGNSYTWIEWNDRNLPRALWPVTPERVQIRKDSDTGPLRYFIRDKEGQYIEFPAADILHIRGLGYDGIQGHSPVAMLRETMGLAKASQNSSAAMYRRGVTSKLAIEVPGNVNEVQMNTLSKNFEAANAGSKNAGRAIILQGGMVAKPISINPVDAQFLEQAKYQDAKIYQIYGIPPHMVGDTEKSTSWGTGIEQQTIGFITFTLLPWLKMIQTWMESKLLPASGEYFIEYDVKGLLQGDSKARSEWYRAMVEMGIYSPNMVLNHENETPYEGGDVFRRPMNTWFVNSDGNVVLSTESATGGSPEGESDATAA